VIRNIVALPDAPAARAEQGGAAGGALILGVGRLNEQKNWPTLLQALERVFAQRPDARAVVLGEGPLQNVLQAQIETSAALRGRVSLPGYAADVAAWYRRANVLVSLSHFEGTPNTVFEAMAALCPVVVSDIPEHREIAGPDSALLVPRASAPAAAAAILDVLADPGAAHRRAQRARQNIERWGADAVAAAYLEVYRSCARPRAQPAHE
jgi:glycosyltransferase involved in cell wall biosynthesis